MTQLNHEPIVAGSERPSRSRGLVFVPCAICRAPVDLAVVTRRTSADLREALRDGVPAAERSSCRSQ